MQCDLYKNPHKSKQEDLFAKMIVVEMFLRVVLIFSTLVAEFSQTVKCSNCNVVRQNSDIDKLLPILNSNEEHLINLLKEIIEINKINYAGAILFAIKGFDRHYQSLFSDYLNSFLREIDSNEVMVKTDYDEHFPEDLVVSMRLTVYIVDSFRSMK